MRQQFKCNTYMALVGAPSLPFKLCAFSPLVLDEFEEISPHEPRLNNESNRILGVSTAQWLTVDLPAQKRSRAFSMKRASSMKHGRRAPTSAKVSFRHFLGTYRLV